MQRRIKQSNRNRPAVHDLERILDVLFDEFEQLIQSLPPFRLGFADDHFPQQKERLLAALAVKHMLSPEKSDAFGSKFKCLSCVFWRLGIGSNAKNLYLVNQLH